MPETLERAQVRLQNITIVKPLLEALKTISLGSWQASQRAARFSDAYRSRILAIFPQVYRLVHHNHERKQDPYLQRKGVLVVLGSERGLCGNFNRQVVKMAAKRMDELKADSQTFDLIVFGSSAGRVINREYGAGWSASLQKMPSVPSSRMAGEWSATWLNAFDRGELDWVEIICNQNMGTASYKTKMLRIIPFQLPQSDKAELDWPEPILDTDPQALAVNLLRQLVALDLYQILLYSSIAEHTARFQLMEEAAGNADQLIEELSQDVQAARRQAITQEMEELAVGAGLL